MARVIIRPFVRWAIALTLIYIGTGVLSCYDHLHPPATPGGDPSNYPPLTDDKAPRGHDSGAGPDGGVPRS